MGSRDAGSRTVEVPENRRAPEVVHFTARTERPQSPRDGEREAGGSSGDPNNKEEENKGSAEPEAGGSSEDPNNKKEENNGSGWGMRILRGVGVAAVGVAAVAVVVGGAVLLGGALSSSGGSEEWDDDNDKEEKMMIAPGTDRKFKIPREDFEANPRDYFRGLRNKN